MLVSKVFHNNRVIGYELKLDRSILKEDKQTRKKDTLFHRYLEQIKYQISTIYNIVGLIRCVQIDMVEKILNKKSWKEKLKYLVR